MKFEITSKWTAILAGAGASFTSIFLTIKTNNDPVNAPKLVCLAAFSGALMGIWVVNFKSLYKKSKFQIYCSLLMFLGLIFSAIHSEQAFIQNFYGVTGRNTGVLTYLLLVVIICAIPLVDNRLSHLKYIFYGLTFATIWNALYGLLQITGNDPVDWTNPYKSFLGTFGNPDFSSAFMGIGITAMLPVIFANTTQWYLKIFLGSVSVIGTIEIEQSAAIQGKVILLIGGFAYLLFFLKSKFKGLKPVFLTLILGIAFAFMGLLGILQVGPLKEYLYKPSVSLRGFYWNAGLEMFKSSPFFGLGFDSYGEYYTQFRSAASIVSPGSIMTVSNSAHNVIIDMLASGGLLFTLPYLALVLVAIYRIILKFKQNEITGKFEQGLVIAWLGYLFQSLVSINQIGLAVWGWVLLGSIFVITRDSSNYVTENGSLQKKSRNKSNVKSLLSATEFASAFIGFLIFLIISLPPQIADANWIKAMRSRDINNVMRAAQAFPLSSWRLAESSRVLLQNGFKDQSLLLAQKAVEFNPRNYNSLITLGNNPLTSGAKKAEIKKTLSILDPRDPTWRK